MRVYVVLCRMWVWDIDQVKLIINMDTDANVYMVVCWLFVVFLLKFLLVQLAVTWCLHDNCKISLISLTEKTLNKDRRKKKKGFFDYIESVLRIPFIHFNFTARFNHLFIHYKLSFPCNTLHIYEYFSHSLWWVRQTDWLVDWLNCITQG